MTYRALRTKFPNHGGTGISAGVLKKRKFELSGGILWREGDEKKEQRSAQEDNMVDARLEPLTYDGGGCLKSGGWAFLGCGQRRDFYASSGDPHVCRTRILTPELLTGKSNAEGEMWVERFCTA
jgi:hypothetical protein